MAINRNSPEFMFGQILQRLDEGDKVMEGFRQEIALFTRAVGQLPCSDSQRRISALEAWRAKLNDNKVFQSQSFTKFKYTLMVSLITASFTSGLTFLVMKLGG
jgi:hypothetical protein